MQRYCINLDNRSTRILMARNYKDAFRKAWNRFMKETPQARIDEMIEYRKKHDLELLKCRV